MNPPPTPDEDLHREDLPLRHRKSRAREAEQIRQDFIKSKRRMLSLGTDPGQENFGKNEE